MKLRYQEEYKDGTLYYHTHCINCLNGKHRLGMQRGPYRIHLEYEEETTFLEVQMILMS